MKSRNGASAAGHKSSVGNADQTPVPSRVGREPEPDHGRNGVASGDEVRKAEGGVGPSDSTAQDLYLVHLYGMLAELLDDRLEQVVAQVESRVLGRTGRRDHQELAMITERELAELLRCDPRTIRRLESAGSIPPALRIGGSKRWLATDVRTWVAGMLEEARS